jgi:hypothetical protein
MVIELSPMLYPSNREMACLKITKPKSLSQCSLENQQQPKKTIGFFNSNSIDSGNEITA